MSATKEVSRSPTKVPRYDLEKDRVSKDNGSDEYNEKGANKFDVYGDERFADSEYAAWFMTQHIILTNHPSCT